MLLSLSVKNFILIDKLELEFNKGLSVVTGETGAGKSILLEAILFSLGAKASDEIIKIGQEQASVTSIFSISDEIKNLLAQIHIECDEDIIVLRRIQMIGNRKKLFINDQAVSAKILKDIGDALLELHSQNSHIKLLEPSFHIEILDNYGNYTELKTSIADNFKLWQNIEKEIKLLNQERDDIKNEIDYLHHTIKELSELNIKEGEELSLMDIRLHLQTRNKKIELINDILCQIENPELDQSINNALRIMMRNSNHDFEEISKELDEAYILVDSARNKLKFMINSDKDNEHNLEDIENRFFAIREKAKKYGISSDKILEFLGKSKEKLSSMQNKIVNGEQLERELKIVKEEYLNLSGILSEKRKKTAHDLTLKLQNELALLKMEKTLFKIEIASLSEREARINGMDIVRFSASINPGSPISPIDEIASGGELSRFMLALHIALSDKAKKDTIIFDEIDTGIGGISAESVGQSLKKLSNFTQVIVITHQALVAKKGDQHLSVTKEQSKDNTKIQIKTLNEEERRTEIARMISGESMSENIMKTAEEFLSNEIK